MIDRRRLKVVLFLADPPAGKKTSAFKTQLVPHRLAGQLRQGVGEVIEFFQSRRLTATDP